MILLSFAVLYGYQNAVDIILFSALHETGHLVMLLIFGVKPKKITLSFYGAGLKYNNTLSKSREFFVLLCGPLVNLILFVVFKNEINLLFPKISSAVTVLFLILLTGLSCYLMFEFKIFSLLLIALYLITFNLKDMRG